MSRYGVCDTSHLPLTTTRPLLSRWFTSSRSEMPSRRRAACSTVWWICGFSRLFLSFLRSSVGIGSSVCVCSQTLCFYILSQHCHVCGGQGGKLPPSIIELIMFFLCYCPLFQKSPAKEKHTLETRLRLVTNIRPCLYDDIFRLKLLLAYVGHLRQFQACRFLHKFLFCLL